MSKIFLVKVIPNPNEIMADNISKEIEISPSDLDILKKMVSGEVSYDDYIIYGTSEKEAQLKALLKKLESLNGK